MRRLTVLVSGGDAARSVTVGDEDIIGDLDLSAAAAELQGKIDTVGEDAVANDYIAGNPSVGMEYLVLHLRRDSIDHTSCLERLGGTSETRVGRISGHIMVLVAEVDMYTVDDEGAFGLFRHHVVQDAVGMDHTFRTVGTELVLCRLDLRDILHGVALREIAVPSALEGNEVIDLDITGVHVSEVVALGDTDDGSVLPVVANEIKNSLQFFFRRSGRLTISTTGSGGTDIINNSAALDCLLGSFVLLGFLLLLDLVFLRALLNSAFDATEVTAELRVCRQGKSDA